MITSKRLGNNRSAELIQHKTKLPPLLIVKFKNNKFSFKKANFFSSPIGIYRLNYRYEK